MKLAYLLLFLALLSALSPVEIHVKSTDTPVIIVMEPNAQCQWVHDEINDTWRLAAIIQPAPVQRTVVSDRVQMVTSNWLVRGNDLRVYARACNDATEPNFSEYVTAYGIGFGEEK